MRSYKLSRSELKFVSIFRTLKVESLWVEVRKGEKDRIAAFIYVPSGRPSDFIFSCKLTNIAPVYEVLPLSEETFLFGARNKQGKVLKSVITRSELLDFIDADFSPAYLKQVLEKKVCLIGNMGTYYPSVYNPLVAKRLYSSLHTEAKADAYLFDVDVALLEKGGRDFIYLIEYKTGREALYRGDLLTYNERVGYKFLSREYRTLLVVGENSFSVYDFDGNSEELIDNVKREHLEDFLLQLKERAVA